MSYRRGATVRGLALKIIFGIIGGLAGGFLGSMQGPGVFEPLTCVFGALAGMALPWAAGRLPSPFTGL